MSPERDQNLSHTYIYIERERERERGGREKEGGREGETEIVNLRQ
jgi:hypothetical protein